MAGIRLHHPQLKNCVLAVEAVRAYKQPYQCPLCGTTHLHKTIHLTLDNEGDVIVSRKAWNELKDLPGLPVEMQNPVKEPPAIVLSMDGQQNELKIHEVPFQGRRK